MAKTLIAYFSRADENYFGGTMRYVKVGDSERDIKETCPGANVKNGLSINGSSAADSAGSVKRWLTANDLM